MFTPSEIHIQYPKIQDVYVDQDILDRIFGIYDVHLATATIASGIEAHIDGVEAEAAQGLKNLLLKKLQNGNSSTTPESTSSEVFHQTVEPTVSLSQISSETYPISRAWIVQQAFVKLVMATSLILITSTFVNLPGKDGTSLADTLPFDMHNTRLFFWIILIVFFFMEMVYTAIWRTEFSFNFLPDFIMVKQGVLAVEEKHMPYRAVQDVTVSQGLVERLLGIATVRIENASTELVPRGRSFVSVNRGIVFPGQSIANATAISDAVKNIILTKSATHIGL